MLKIVTPADELYRPRFPGYDIELSACRGVEIQIVEIPASATEDEFIEAAQTADGLYAKVMSRPITRRIIEQLKQCRVISAPSVGVEMIDLAAATERGIPVTNVPDVYTDEVADHTMALLLACARRLSYCDDKVRAGNWSDVRPYLSEVPRLYGQTLGLVGFGRIARAVARRAMPFGLRIVAHDPYIDQSLMTASGIEPVSLQRLLEVADIISVHTPSTKSAMKLIGAAEFSKIKRGALFINTGRAHAVDERALLEALDDGRIAFAGLDVFDHEPLGLGSPFMALKNVILTPHVAPVSSRFEEERRRRVGTELSLVLDGRWPLSCVNPSVLNRSALERWQAVSFDRGPRA